MSLSLYTSVLAVHHLQTGRCMSSDGSSENDEGIRALCAIYLACRLIGGALCIVDKKRFRSCAAGRTLQWNWSHLQGRECQSQQGKC